MKSSVDELYHIAGPALRRGGQPFVSHISQSLVTSCPGMDEWYNLLAKISSYSAEGNFPGRKPLELLVNNIHGNRGVGGMTGKRDPGGAPSASIMRWQHRVTWEVSHNAAPILGHPGHSGCRTLLYKLAVLKMIFTIIRENMDSKHTWIFVF